MTPYDLYTQIKEAALKDGVKFHAHQREAIKAIDDNDGSLLIAHGTGTGKTGTSVGAVEHLRSKGKAGVTLAVTPASLRDNFIEGGVHKFTDGHAVRLGPHGEAGSHHIDRNIPKAHYYVVSNEMFRKDPHKYIDRTGANTIVWDEMHKGRDEDTINYQAMMAVRPKVRNFIGLTGTPIMNHPRDIVPQLDVVTNKKHGLGSQRDFDRNFTAEATKFHGPLGFFGVGEKSTHTVLKNKDYLRNELAKHVHHVSSEDVADMPEKVLHDVEVPMSHEQSKLYDFALAKVDPMTRHRIRNNLPVGSSEAMHIFSRIMHARQASNALHTLDSGHTPGSSADSVPKTKKLLDDVHAHLQENPKHKAIIYTNLVNGGVDVMSEGLKARGYEHGLFIGSSQEGGSKKFRDTHVKDYLEGKKRVMLINTAGTEGLNLPGTTAHFTLDPHFNPAMTEQAEARGIRAGSPVGKVHVFRYKSVKPQPFGIKGLPRETGTDEWIYNIAARKEKLNNEFTSLMKRRTKSASEGDLAPMTPYDVYMQTVKSALAVGDPIAAAKSVLQKGLPEVIQAQKGLHPAQASTNIGRAAGEAAEHIQNVGRLALNKADTSVAAGMVHSGHQAVRERLAQMQSYRLDPVTNSRTLMPKTHERTMAIIR